MNETYEVPTRDLQMMLLSSFRYALGRRSYLPSVVVEWLESYWHILPDGYKHQIRDDIATAITNGAAGADCDQQEWKKVLLWMEPRPF